MPIPFNREMTGHNPAYYTIPPAELDDFNILVIEDTTSWLYVLDGNSVLRRHLAAEVAEELLSTFIQANLYVGEGSRPGIFWVEGGWTKKQIEENFGAELEEARDAQNQWFKALVEKADDDWNRSRQHRTISTPQRIAADRLGLKREWNIQVEKGQNYIPCPACETMLKSTVSVCPQCKLIIKENADFQFAS
jgi:hypothetical protein